MQTPDDGLWGQPTYSVLRLSSQQNSDYTPNQTATITPPYITAMLPLLSLSLSLATTP